MALAWSHAVLNIRDETRMRDFYTRVLGFQVTDEGPIGDDRKIIFMSQAAAEHHQIALVPGRDDTGPSNSLAHLAFRVDDMAELRALIARLKQEDLSLRPTSHGNTWSVYFQDPELNGVEIFCDTPWQVKQPAGETWDMTLDDDALLAWTHEKFQNAERFGSQDDFIARRTRELERDGHGGH
jgi:catechol 2,3-dioxygenase